LPYWYYKNSYKEKPYLTKPTRKGYSGLKPLACFHRPAKARGLSTAVRVKIKVLRHPLLELVGIERLVHIYISEHEED
jgi:hypothetical protein